MPACWLIQGDALTIPLRDKSVHSVVTSPPYWGAARLWHSGEVGRQGAEANN